MACFYCGTEESTRPYGPGGADICFPCMKADPEREAEALRNLGVQLEAAAAMSPIGVAIIGPDSGPDPLVLTDEEVAQVGDAVRRVMEVLDSLEDE